MLGYCVDRVFHRALILWLWSLVARPFSIRRSVPVLLLCGLCTIASAEDKGSVQQIDDLELENLVDAQMNRAMSERNIPGGVVGVILEGRLALLKGYGVSDVQSEAAVDPEASLFRIASISKLFVAIAVMQQVDLGRLDLDRDIRDYLGADLPPLPLGPITARQLLTHSAGFQYTMSGIFVPADSAAPSLQAVIDAALPRQAYAPGTWPAYSNLGFVLLGRLVEVLSGESYDQYVLKQVMAPLGMHRSSAHQPLPSALRGAVVTSYEKHEDLWSARPFEIVAASPGGAITASAADMMRFAQYLLQSEAGAELLSRESLSELTQRQFAAHPLASGMGLGFPLQQLQGQPAWYHTGGLMAASSRLTALPDSDFALFTAFNVGGPGHGAGNDLLHALLDYYFPVAANALREIRSGQDLSQFEGSYQTSGSFMEGPVAFFATSGQTRVQRKGDSGLELVSPWGTTQWQWISSDRFQQLGEVDSSGFGDLLFVRDAEDAVTAFLRQNQATRVSLKQPLFAEAATASATALGIVVTGVFTFGLTMIALFKARAGRAPTVYLAAAYIVLGVFLFGYTSLGPELASGDWHALALPWFVRALFLLPGLALLTALVGLTMALKVVSNAAHATGYRLLLLACMLQQLLAFAFLYYWDLLL